MNNLFTHYVPWTSDKDLSGYYDFTIRNSPTDWVLLTDRDVFMLHPHYGLHIEEVIRKHGNKFTLLTSLTNRVGTPYQVNQRLSKIEDMSILTDAAISHWRAHGARVEDITGKSPISGMLMLVHKRLLDEGREIKGNGLLGIDNFIHYLARDNGMRVGLMHGILCYHYYRNNDRNDTSHLK